MKEIKLFDYQQEMLEDIIEAFSIAAFDSVFYDEKGKKVNVGSSVMVQMPMGTGKTYLMAAVVKWFLETHSKGEVWLIAHRKELVEQMARPTLSLAKYLQMVGRGLRINKEDPEKVCMIIDNVGNYRKFGYPDLPRNWEAMYAGLTAGKGIVPPHVKKRGYLIVVEEDMVMVKKAT